MLISYIAKRATVCKHSGIYDQSSPILESCLLRSCLSKSYHLEIMSPEPYFNDMSAILLQPWDSLK